MSPIGSWMLSAAILLCIGGILIAHVEACTTVTNCIDCSTSSGVCTNCSTLFGLDYKTPTSTLCTQCNSGTNNCQSCTNIKNCTKCTNVATMGPDYGLGSCSLCSPNCQRCGTAGGGKCNICNPGYVLNPSTMLCEGCSANCSNCGVSGAGKCDVCVDGYGLHNATRLCDQCMTGCAKCARDITSCTMCTSTTQVPMKDGSGMCGACSDNCANCTVSGVGHCDMCTPPYMLVNSSMTCMSNSTNNMTMGNSSAIASRSAWTSTPLPASIASRTGPYDFLIFHMTFTKPCTNKADCLNEIKSIEKYQMTNTGEPCISYHYLIGENGKIYEGRGADKVGVAINPKYDMTAVNIAVIGTFTARPPNAAAMRAIGSLFEMETMTAMNLSSTVKYLTHFDVACTRCPGPAFRKKLHELMPDKHGDVPPPTGCGLTGRGFPKPMK